MTVYILAREGRYCDCGEFSVVKAYSNILSATDGMRQEWEKTLLEFGMNNDTLDANSDTYLDELSAVVDDGDDIVCYYIEELEVEE